MSRNGTKSEFMVCILFENFRNFEQGTKRHSVVVLEVNCIFTSGKSFDMTPKWSIKNGNFVIFDICDFSIKLFQIRPLS